MSEKEPLMDIRWIMSVIPHRYPLLLIDRVLEIEPKKSIVAIKNVTVNEEFFSGHFPGHPVMPGVLVIEAMAQAGGVLLMHDVPDRDNKLIYFTTINKAKFRRPVVPGDQLRIEIDILRLREIFCKLSAKALVDSVVAPSMSLAKS